MVFTGDALVSLQTRRVWDSEKTRTWVIESQTLAAIDLRDPSNPRAAGKLTLPSAPFNGLQVGAGKVYTSHHASIGDGKVRFYLDEIDVSNPDAPALARSVNVPGSLLAFDPTSARAITVDYKRTYWDGVTDGSTCQEKAPLDYVIFDWEGKRCSTVHRSLRLVKLAGTMATLEQSFELPAARIGSVTVAAPRVVLRSTSYGYVYDTVPGGATPSSATPTDRLWVMTGMREGAVQTSPAIDLDKGWGGGVWAEGDRAVAYTGVRKLAVVDTTSASAAKVIRSVELNGYYPYHVAMSADAAYVSLGDQGLTSVPLR